MRGDEVLSGLSYPLGLMFSLSKEAIRGLLDANLLRSSYWGCR